MTAAVIAVLKGSGFCLSDGSLLRDRVPALAVLCPDIGAVINVPLLLEGGVFGQNLLVGVFVVICAQSCRAVRMLTNSGFPASAVSAVLAKWGL